eukprot:scaffold305_cov110-Cylindrotheca_fusiformis.AAC.26
MASLSLSSAATTTRSNVICTSTWTGDIHEYRSRRTIILRPISYNQYKYELCQGAHEETQDCFVGSINCKIVDSQPPVSLIHHSTLFTLARRSQSIHY